MPSGRARLGSSIVLTCMLLWQCREVSTCNARLNGIIAPPLYLSHLWFPSHYAPREVSEARLFSSTVTSKPLFGHFSPLQDVSVIPWYLPWGNFGFVFSPPFLKRKKHLLEPWNLSHIFFLMALAVLSTLLLLGEQTFIPSLVLLCERRTPSANLHLSKHLSEWRIKVLLCKMAPVAVLINTCLMDCLPGVFQEHHFSC